MALSEEQKAMMRLLAQRDVGYEDVAVVMGVSVEEVQEKVNEALASMGDEAEGAAPGPAADDAVPPAPARRARRPRRPRKPLPRPHVSVPPERRRFVGLAAGALAAIGVVLLLIYLIDGSSSGSSTATEAATEASTAAKNITQATLEPVGGGDAHGRALFGRIRNQAVLQVQAEGLPPSPQGKSYTVWLYRSPKLALRVGAVKVNSSGGLGAQFPLPSELLGILAGGAFDRVNVTLTDDAAYRAEIVKAKKEKRLPAYSGTTALSGEITGSLVEQSQ
jgi:hypothetical protein